MFSKSHEIPKLSKPIPNKFKISHVSFANLKQSHIRVSQKTSNFEFWAALVFFYVEMTQKKFQLKILKFGPPRGPQLFLKTLIEEKFEICVLPSCYIPIDAEFHADFKNV